MQRLRDPAGAVAAPQKVARARLGKGFVVDISQFREAGDQRINGRFILACPPPAAQLALQIVLELRLRRGIAPGIAQRQIAH